MIEAGQVHGAVVLRQGEGLLRGHVVGAGRCVIFDIIRRGAGIQPFAHVTFGGSGAAGELGGSEFLSRAHGAIEVELVSDDDQRGMQGSAHIADGLTKQGVELVHIKRTVCSLGSHESSPWEMESCGRLGGIAGGTGGEARRGPPYDVGGSLLRPVSEKTSDVSARSSGRLNSQAESAANWASFRIRSDMADLSKKGVCCEQVAGQFVGSQGARRAVGSAGAAMGFPSTCLRLAYSIGGLAYGETDRPIFGTLSHEQNWKNEGICHHKMATKRDSTG